MNDFVCKPFDAGRPIRAVPRGAGRKGAGAAARGAETYNRMFKRIKQLEVGSPPLHQPNPR
jgi:hypothetical protein